MKGSVPTSLEKLQALVVWGIWHEVDSGVTSVIVSNAQIARTPEHAQVDLPREERRSVSEPRGRQASRPPGPLPDTSAGSSSSSSSSRPRGPGIGACGLGKLAEGIPGAGPGGVRPGVALKAMGSATLRTWDEESFRGDVSPGGRVGTLGGHPLEGLQARAVTVKSPLPPPTGPPTRGVFPPFSSPQSRSSTSLTNGRQPGEGRARQRAGGRSRARPAPSSSLLAGVACLAIQ